MSSPYPPPFTASASSLARPRVVSAVLDGLRFPVCLLLAATGYGKTEAAYQCWHAFAGRKAWWSAADARRCGELASAAQWAWQAQEPVSDAPGLLVVDLDHQSAEPELWAALAHHVEQMPAAARLLLLCRSAPLPLLAHWRRQQRLHLLDHRLLALDAGEWQAAGLDSVVPLADAAGWWGAAGWLQASHGAWPATLADWVAQVWFPSLTLAQRTLLGQLSLLPERTLPELAALHGCDLVAVEGGARELAGQCGVLQLQADRVALLPHFRLSVAQAWRASDHEAWQEAVQAILQDTLARQQLRTAVQLAEEVGPGRARVYLLQNAGMQLLYTQERARLSAWLALPLGQDDAALNLLQCAWLLEVEKSAHRADALLQRCLPLLSGEARAQALALQATIALDYDEAEQADALASAALAEFSDSRHPLSMRARLTRGSARAIKGRLDEAAEDLGIAHRCAEREQLPYLQLDALQRRALLALEQGQRAQAQLWLEQALRLLGQQALQHTSAADSCRRQLAWQHLEMLDAAQARQVREAQQAFWAFPQHIHLAVEALLEDRLADARQATDWLMRTLESSFLPRKWQNQAVWVDIWLAGHDQQQQRLHYWQNQLARAEGPSDVHADRRRVLLAGVRCLLGQADDVQELRSLHERLQQGGAHALALQLQLLLAVQAAPVLTPEAYACLREGAHRQAHLDYLWLGPRVAPLLQQALAAADSGQDPVVHAFVRRLLQRLLAPVPAQTGQELEAVAGLTAKETRILYLIGQHYSNEQIAACLFISLATVKTHINHIYSKLALKSRSEAMQRARQLFI